MFGTTRKTLAALAVGAATTAQLVGVPTAVAAEPAPAPAIEILPGSQHVNVQGDVAWTHGTYRCRPDVEMTHVWVSVKQGGDDLEGHGSSERATSWYDTNVSFEGVEPTLTCDGEWRHLKVELGKAATKDRLQDGTGWLQFCLYAVTDSGEFSGASDNRWADVKVGGRP